MKDSEAKKSISNYLKSQNEMTLATVDPEGKPVAHTVEFVSDETTVYFATGKDTRKAKNIANNSTVAYTVDRSYDNWMEIQGVQMEGVATILSDNREVEKASALYIKKYPFVADFPSNPDLVFIKVEPVEGFFLNYTKGFAHKDIVNFG